MPLNVSKAVLYAFLFYPTVNFYLSLALGIAIPYLGDVLLSIALTIFVCLNPTKRIHLGGFDGIMLLLLLSTAPFVAANLASLPGLLRIAEIRYVMLIPGVYFLFRFGLASDDARLDAETVIHRVLLVHCAWIPLEFVLLNFLAPGIADRAAAVYPDRERVFEAIFQFTRPIGLFPGTGNAALAASLLLLMCVNRGRPFGLPALLAVISMVATFSLTSGLTLLVGLGLLGFASDRPLYVKAFAGLLGAVLIAAALYFQYEITSFRIQGSGFVPIPERGFENLLPYRLSLEDAVTRMSILPHHFSEPSLREALGIVSEIYLLRVGIYYGYATLALMVMLMAALAIRCLRDESRTRRILLAIPFLMLFASLHYPVINGVPLYLLLPLAIWRAVTMPAARSESRAVRLRIDRDELGRA